MMYSNLVNSILFGTVIASIVWCIQFSIKWRRHRAQYKDLPCAPHSFWWGHLKVMGEVMAQLQPDVHPQVAMAMMGEKYNLGSVFYVDLWPIARPMMMIHDPNVAAQIAQNPNLPKHTLNKEFLRNMTGEHSIVTAEGAEWKSLRSMLGPGFSSQHLASAVPDMVKHVLVLKKRLDRYSESQEVIQLQEFATATTIDVIGEIVLGKNLDTQQKPNPLATNFRKTISWSGSSMNVIARAQSYLPMWWYCRQLDRGIRKAILERRKTHGGDVTGSKTVIDLALKAYEEDKLGPSKGNNNELHPEFMTLAINNVKTLLLGGHDTTATTISYTIFLLSTHPDILSDLRAEHDQIFTSDPSAAANLIISDPKLLSNTCLPLTTAVLHEALRLYPAGSTLRMSTAQHTTVRLPDSSTTLPLANHVLWISHYAIGRRADLWPDPLSFQPARMLPENASHQPKDAWRSFEKGPRNCLGKEMAMLEMKIVLVLLMREFDFQTAYAPDAKGVPEEYGGTHYQMVEFGPKPAGHMPMRVCRREMIV